MELDRSFTETRYGTTRCVYKRTREGVLGEEMSQKLTLTALAEMLPVMRWCVSWNRVGCAFWNCSVADRTCLPEATAIFSQVFF